MKFMRESIFNPLILQESAKYPSPILINFEYIKI